MDTTVTVKGYINPFAPEYYGKEVSADITLFSAIREYARRIETEENLPEGSAWRLIKYCNVFVNNITVPPEEWETFIVNSDDEIICNIIPHGGGEGKDPLRTVATIALMAGMMAAGSYLGGPTGMLAAMEGWTSLTASIATVAATTAIGAAGMLAVNALFPVRVKDNNADTSKDTAYQISGGGNQFKHWQTVPVMLGRMRVAPPFAAQPYTVNVERGEQDWYAIYVWGYARQGNVDSLKIGGTPIEQFGASVNTRTYILMPGGKTGFYSGSVIETPVGVTLKGPEQDDLKWVTRTTAGKVDDIGVDISFPTGIFKIESSGKYESALVEFDIQYCLAGTNAWKSFFQDVFIKEAYGTFAAGGLGVSKAVNLILFDRITQTINSVWTDLDPTSYRTQPLWRITIESTLRIDQDYFDKRISRIEDLRTAEMKTVKAFALTSPTSADIGKSQGPALDYSPVITWAVASSTYTLPYLTIIDNFRAAIIYTQSKAVDSGRYDVRVRRMTRETDDNTIDLAQFYLLRSSNKDMPAIKFPYPVLITEMRVRAGVQFSRQVDSLTGVMRQMIPDWNGASWTMGYTSNPASIIRYVLMGDPTERRVKEDMIDNESFVEFWKHCKDNHFEYNKYCESADDVTALIGEIAAAGRAFVVQPNGKYAIVIDRVKDAPVQHFTPANSWGFETTRQFYDLPEAFRVAFFNEQNDWQTDERIVYDDGYNDNNATFFESLQIAGVTNPDQIYKLGREYIKAARLRPETHTLNVDMEYLIAGRRDLVRVSHDVLMVGLAYGRIKRVVQNTAITGVEIENTAHMAIGTNYGITIRSSRDASIMDKQVVTKEGEDNILTFVTPAPLGSIAAGDMYSFGEFGKTTEDYIISHIEPTEGLNAQITLISYAPKIYNDPGEVAPQFKPNVNMPVIPQLVMPGAPHSFTFHETLELRGNIATNVCTITWMPPIASPVPVETYQFAYRQSGSSWIDYGDSPGRMAELIGPAAGMYDFRARSVSIYGIASDWAVATDQRLTGDLIPLADVTGLTTYFSDNRLQLAWTPVPDIRSIRYEIRKGGSWNNSQILKTQTETIFPVNIDGLYFVKARTNSGMYSANPASLSVTGAAGLQTNVVAVHEDAPLWMGEKTGFVVQRGDLWLSGINRSGSYTAYRSISIYMSEEVSINLTYTANAYKNDDIYAIADIYNMSDIYGLINAAFLIFPEIQIAGASVPDIYQISNIYSVPDIHYAEEVNLWDDWKPFSAGKYIGRHFRFRLRAEVSDPDVSLIISNFSYLVDVPDKLITRKNIEIPEDGYVWIFEPPFNAPPTVIGSVVDAEEGDNQKKISVDPLIAIDKAIIYISDDTGAYVSGVANLYAQGY